MRGRLGAVLRRIDPVAYERIFAPQSSGGPSGLRNAPRPFVLRLNDSYLGVNLFDTREDTLDLIRTAVSEPLDDCEMVRLSLDPPQREVRRVRVRFVTPTELKGSRDPEFGVLFARIRDRISTLRALYGPGPLHIDFAGIGERARAVQMTRCELQHVDSERVSRNTGQRHSIGGFVGIAEYEGDLTEFVPYLEAARWTGAGRQTVWGKGEIHSQEI